MIQYKLLCCRIVEYRLVFAVLALTGLGRQPDHEAILRRNTSVLPVGATCFSRNPFSSNQFVMTVVLSFFIRGSSTPALIISTSCVTRTGS